MTVAASRTNLRTICVPTASVQVKSIVTSVVRQVFAVFVTVTVLVIYVTGMVMEGLIGTLLVVLGFRIVPLVNILLQRFWISTNAPVLTALVTLVPVGGVGIVLIAKERAT